MKIRRSEFSLFSLLVDVKACHALKLLGVVCIFPGDCQCSHPPTCPTSQPPIHSNPKLTPLDFSTTDNTDFKDLNIWISTIFKFKLGVFFITFDCTASVCPFQTTTNSIKSWIQLFECVLELLVCHFSFCCCFEDTIYAILIKK